MQQHTVTSVKIRVDQLDGAARHVRSEVERFGRNGWRLVSTSTVQDERYAHVLLYWQLEK